MAKKALVSKPLGVLLQIGGGIGLCVGIVSASRGDMSGLALAGISILIVLVGGRTKNRE